MNAAMTGPVGILDAPVSYDVHEPVRSGPGPDLLADHLDRYGPLPATTGGSLLDTLDRIRLAGRGGAHFSAAAKWRSALDCGGGGTVVATGVEGEPASAKDAALLTHRPHLVLDGIACAARAIGATDSVVYLREDSWQVRRAMERAVAERLQARGAGEPPVRIVTGPHSYVSGESTAVLQALSGGPAVPQFLRRLPTVSGLRGRPTLIHNVETLARVGLAARSGAERYRDSTLVTVVDRDRRVVLEVSPATSIALAVTRALGSFPAPQAVLLGGYGGSWLPWATAADLPLEHQALRAVGAGLGAGVLAPLPAGACGLAETAGIVRYLAASGARQCGPCLFGLPAVADLVDGLARGEGSARQLRRLRRYLDDLARRGGCSHPDGVLRMVRSALGTFDADVREHTPSGRCLHPGADPVLPVPGGAQVLDGVAAGGTAGPGGLW